MTETLPTIDGTPCRDLVAKGIVMGWIQLPEDKTSPGFAEAMSELRRLRRVEQQKVWQRESMAKKRSEHKKHDDTKT